MGLLSWIEDKATGAWDGVCAAGNAVGDLAVGIGKGVAEVGMQIGGTVVGGATKLVRATGVDVGRVEWAESRIEQQGNFCKYVYENPGRAGALCVQGVVNGVTSIGGLVLDGTRFIIYDNGIRHVINAGSYVGTGAVNLFRDEDNQIEALHLDRPKFMTFSDQLNKLGTISNYTDSAVWQLPQEFITDADGNLIPNPNIAYERGILYGSQFITEMVITAPLLGGASALLGGTLAAGRGVVASSRIAAVASKFPAATSIANAARATGTMAATAFSKVPLVGNMTRWGTASTLGTAKTAKTLDRLEDVVEAMDKLRKIETARKGGSALTNTLFARAPREALARRATNRALGRTLAETTADDLASLAARGKPAEKLAAAQEKLAALRSSGTASAQELQKAAKAVNKATDKMERVLEPIQAYAKESGLKLPPTAAPRAVAGMTAGQNVLETARLWGWRARRATSPFEQGLRTDITIAGGTTHMEMERDKAEQRKGNEESQKMNSEVGSEALERTRSLFDFEVVPPPPGKSRTPDAQGQGSGQTQGDTGQGTGQKKETGTSPLRGDFKDTKPKGAPPSGQKDTDTGSTGGGDDRGGQTSMLFDNRAQAIVVPTTMAFTLTDQQMRELEGAIARMGTTPVGAGR